MVDPSLPAWERRFRAPTPTFPTWSRHAADHLVYVSNDSGSYQAYTCDLTTGARRRVSEARIGVHDATPSADGAAAIWFDDESGDESGRWVAAPFEGGPTRPLFPDLEPGWPAGLALGRDVVVVGRADRGGYAIEAWDDGAPRRQLYASGMVAYIGGSAGERGGFNLGGLSADDRLVCIEHAERGDEVRRALRVFDVSTGEVAGEQWDGEGLGLEAAAWSPVPGDQRLALRHELHDRERPAIWDLERRSRRNLDVGLPGDVVALDWWPDASALLVKHAFEGRDELFRLGLAEGGRERIEHPEGSIDDARVRPDGDVWFHISSGGSPVRVLSSRGQDIVRISERAPEGVPFQSWHFANPRGDRVHGFCATPPSGGPFPTIMYVHGGPTWLHADRWNPYVQAFVDHGMAVGLVNYRGSSGYGRAWRDSIIGNIGLPEEEDVACGLEDLVARGIADPGRVAIGGWSWGGYVTLLSIGRSPDRWRAAIGGVPVGDYAAGYDELSPDLQAYDRYLLGGKTPQEVPELMSKVSPIVYARDVRTPTLVLVGRHDTRCPYGQAMAWVDAVRSAGGHVEVYEYDTGHSSHDVDEVVRQMKVILDFLARHLTND